MQVRAAGYALTYFDVTCSLPQSGVYRAVA
jgi:hypothetical protein